MKWRVGRKVPKNVYVGDEIAGQFQSEEWARQAVDAVNDARPDSYEERAVAHQLAADVADLRRQLRVAEEGRETAHERANTALRELKYLKEFLEKAHALYHK